MQIVLSKIYLVFYTLLVILFSINYFTAYSVPGFFTKIYEILSTAFFIFIAKLIGKGLLKYLKLNFFSNIEKNFFEFGLGSGILSLILFFLGISIGFRKYILLIILFLVIILNFSYLKNFKINDFLPKILSQLKKEYNFSIAELILIFISGICLFLMFIS
ncbi:MAG: hypothetical protein ACK4JE_06090, partial [Endomicrobiia bacterium]